MCATSVVHTFLILGVNMSDIRINERIQALRRKKHLTQEKMGKLLGIKTSTYSQLEKNGHISAERIKLLAEIFEVDYCYLIDGNTVNETFEKEDLIKDIREVIRTELKKNYISRYGFLDGVPDSEIGFIRTICCLNKKERIAVYEYAYKLFKKEIKL